jgi:hypothetical protein
MFGVMHAFITAELVADPRHRNRELVCWSGETSVQCRDLYERLATTLEVELERWVVPRIEVFPEAVDHVRCCIKDCDARATFRKHLREFAEKLEPQIREAKPADKKKLLIKAINDLKADYETWLRKLRVFTQLGYVRIVENDASSNLMFLTGRFMRPKVKIDGVLQFAKYVKFHAHTELEGMAAKLLDVSEVKQYVNTVRWHNHLFKIQTQLSDSF